ncbi:sensor histidine kinase [Methylovulum psychrotolerans]|uniref:sensor histidine kinase n=1 Tax=Methylovulum psychrotolerans TaxID=1704499 RepID=UPI0022B769DE|nr:ATP-binding protein [Methylovulum psychrotolerans]
MFLDVDTAIPCGLIISELLTNSLKHAFPEGRRGTIAITFTEDAGEFILVIADTGVGFPSRVDFRNCTSLGLQLVTTLTNQLMGEMTLDGQDGAAFTFYALLTLFKESHDV